MSCLPLSASLTSAAVHPPLAPAAPQTRSLGEETSILESLKTDIAANPADFLPFETESSANRFLAEHAPEAQREAEPRVIARGILGYWRGKTVVVLPTLPTTSQR